MGYISGKRKSLTKSNKLSSYNNLLYNKEGRSVVNSHSLEIPTHVLSTYTASGQVFILIMYESIYSAD